MYGFLLILLRAFQINFVFNRGFGPLPSLHTDFLAYGWATETQFTEALSIGQITPGPNGLWVVSLCYLTAGLTGSILACLALVLPPLSVLFVQKCHSRIAHLAATKGFLDGVVLVLASFTVLVLADMFRHGGMDPLAILIMVVSTILAVTRLVSVNLILLAAALTGALIG